MYGHVLVVGGSFGKSGAPVMTGLGSYRSGAGLVTVAVPNDILPTVAAFRPELMMHSLDPDAGEVPELLKKMTVLAMGPGLGTEDHTVNFVRRLYDEVDVPAVVDADALNALAGRSSAHEENPDSDSPPRGNGTAYRQIDPRGTSRPVGGGAAACAEQRGCCRAERG